MAAIAERRAALVATLASLRPGMQVTVLPARLSLEVKHAGPHAISLRGRRGALYHLVQNVHRPYQVHLVGRGRSVPVLDLRVTAPVSPRAHNPLAEGTRLRVDGVEIRREGGLYRAGGRSYRKLSSALAAVARRGARRRNVALEPIAQGIVVE